MQADGWPRLGASVSDSGQPPPISFTSAVLRGFASAAAPKESLQKGKALFGEQTFRNFDLMVEQLRVRQAELAPDGPEAQITGCEDEPRDTRRDQRSGTHRAGFKRDIKRRVRQPVVAERSRRCPQRLDLGVRGRIAGCNRAVRSSADDLTLLDDDGADRNFLPSALLRELRRARAA